MIPIADITLQKESTYHIKTDRHDITQLLLKMALNTIASIP
jgi:hypothetical protein